MQRGSPPKSVGRRRFILVGQHRADPLTLHGRPRLRAGAGHAAVMVNIGVSLLTADQHKRAHLLWPWAAAQCKGVNPFSWDTSAGDPEDSSSFTHSDKQTQMVI